MPHPTGPRRARRLALAPAPILFLALSLAPPAGTGTLLAQPPASPLLVEAEVILRDGRTFTGTLVEQSPTSVTLNIAGVLTPIQRATIDQLRTLPSVEERYRTLKAMLDPADLDGQLRLAEWLRAKERYDLALLEIESILFLRPEHAQAQELRTIVVQEKLLREKRPAAEPDQGDPGPDAPKPSPRASRPLRADFPLLSPEQVNLIRVYELDLSRPGRLSISREAVERFLDDHAGKEGLPASKEARDAFLRKPPLDIARAMFALRAREHYTDLKVAENPPALRAFRQDVHAAWLLNSCATAQCHGGPNAGRFYLASGRASTEPVVYTNFYIVDRFKLADGTPLINPLEPERSPLLHLALPKDQASFHHPATDAVPSRYRWRPVFSSTTDPRYQASLRFIQSLYRPRPDYPIDYTPPLPPTLPEPGEPPDPPPSPETRPQPR